jgi:hypothetical protein
MSIDVVCEIVFVVSCTNEVWLFEGEICDCFLLCEKELKKHFNIELTKSNDRKTF